NDLAGIALWEGARGNVVQGNYSGTNAAGAAALGNGESGVALFDAPGNTVGGTVTGAGNVISGNRSNGVEISGSFAGGNLVQANRIGTDANGWAALGNGIRFLQTGLGSGVLIDGAPNNTVGGTAAGARNLISGNQEFGIEISGSGAS